MMKLSFRNPAVSGHCAAHDPASGMKAEMPFQTGRYEWIAAVFLNESAGNRD